MSNEVSTSLEKVLSMWSNEETIKEIKSIYAPNATELEFKTFVQMGIATGLNPFLKEIWLVKYDKSAPAQIFIGRDGYRKCISRNYGYKSHQVDAVYSNDDFCFDLTEGKVTHTYNLKDRGKLVGAYCIVDMTTSTKPYYVFVEISEYNTNRSVWKEKPATMIKKVAECQAIRMADSCTFGGTYDPDEMGEIKENKVSSLNKKLELLKDEHETLEGEVNLETGEVKTDSLDGIRERAIRYFIGIDVSSRRILNYFNIESISDLDEKMLSEMATIKFEIKNQRMAIDDAFCRNNIEHGKPNIA